MSFLNTLRLTLESIALKTCLWNCSNWRKEGRKCFLKIHRLTTSSKNRSQSFNWEILSAMLVIIVVKKRNLESEHFLKVQLILDRKEGIPSLISGEEKINISIEDEY